MGPVWQIKEVEGILNSKPKTRNGSTPTLFNILLGLLYENASISLVTVVNGLIANHGKTLK